ncbi:hypothetical protein [Streptomyces sp. UNOC14_S4]|uniref:hypothetical protein n=1 Tax=Streptomyces sp. UNOC14_S4 TaxID=2872340 RepID=UPI001E2B873E|nr:hypothetical protein [Streptomyces sp. UNOC14_S4]
MASDGIDRRAIEKLMKNMQREFDKYPINVPLTADGSVVPAGSTVYNGPVFHGSAEGAQLAWGNTSVVQTQNQTQQVAPGYEGIAQAVTAALENLDAAGLAEEDRQDAEEAAGEVLTEVTRAEPDRGKIRRALSAVKGVLAPVATGLAAGAEEGAQEWARTVIEQLSIP